MDRLTIRLFLSTTSEQRDDAVLAEAPPEVKVVRIDVPDVGLLGCQSHCS